MTTHTQHIVPAPSTLHSSSPSFTADTNALERRVARLESGNRRLRVLLCLGTLGLAGAWLGGLIAPGESLQQPANRREINTQRLIISGSDGSPRAMLTGADGGSSFFLYGPDVPKNERRGGGGGAGQTGGGDGAGAAPAAGMGGVVALSPRIRFMTDATGSRIEFVGDNGKPSLLIKVDGDGPAIHHFDADGNIMSGSDVDDDSSHATPHENDDDGGDGHHAGDDDGDGG
ncbi:MAG: hypothetical protein ACR2GY_08670 [Phycisphaerales bacterium]